MERPTKCHVAGCKNKPDYWFNGAAHNHDWEPDPVRITLHPTCTMCRNQFPNNDYNWKLITPKIAADTSWFEAIP